MGSREAVAIAWLALASSSPASFAGSGVEEALSRSLYVPVTLEVCEHLKDAVLYRDDEPLRSLPGTQIFQFTFFPSLGRVEPEHEMVRVEGTHDGESFRTELVVTPASVYIGSKKIDLDLEKQMRRFRTSLDARHETVELTLRCTTSCARESRRASR